MESSMVENTYHAEHKIHQRVLPSYVAECLAEGCQLDRFQAPELRYEVLQDWRNSGTELMGFKPLPCRAQKLQDPEIVHGFILSWLRLDLSLCSRLSCEVLSG